ncbi:hypothetical protein KR059_003839, partial [Drosophila kikkawai]
LDIRNAFNTASWNRTLESLAALNIPGYLMRIARSYFSERVLTVATDLGSRAYEVSAGVPQGSVLGPLLWNTMYDGVLRLPMPSGTTIRTAAEALANDAITLIESWLARAGLELAAQKTEAVLISSRKTVETAEIRVGGAVIR